MFVSLINGGLVCSDGRGAGGECVGHSAAGEYRGGGRQLVGRRRASVQVAHPEQVREGKQRAVFHCQAVGRWNNPPCRHPPGLEAC